MRHDQSSDPYCAGGPRTYHRGDDNTQEVWTPTPTTSTVMKYTLGNVDEKCGAVHKVMPRTKSCLAELRGEVRQMQARWAGGAALPTALQEVWGKMFRNRRVPRRRAPS